MQSPIINFKNLNLFETIFKHAHNGIAIISLEGQWLKVNKSVTDILGYSSEELSKMTFQDITYKDDLELDLGHVEKLLNGEIENYQIEKRYFNKQGNIVWALLSVSLVRNENQKPQYFISQLIDITQRKQSEKNFKLVLKVIENQNHVLKRFSNIAAHDLKTHVSNLVFISNYLKEDMSSISGNQYFLMLNDALAKLKGTLNNLDEITKARNDKDNGFKSLNLYRFVSNALYNVSALAKNAQCEIKNNVDPDIQVYGLEAYLDSIILNFLTNVIKYRSEKRVLQVELSSHVENDFVVLKIKDNGLGIDLEVFGDKLYDINTTFHKTNDSNGVGLFIANEQIEILGGKIEVESEIDRGSEFSIFFKKYD